MSKWGGGKAARLRAATLETYGDVCHLCGRPGADSADHVIPRSLGGPDTLENLRPAHLACNQSRGASPVLAVTVVTGPPAAGKSTYIADHAKRGDVVIDFDVIAVALQPAGADSHDHPAHIRRIAAAARQAAVGAASSISNGGRVWLIDAMPDARRLARYRASRWRVVTVDPGRAVVLQRAVDAGRPAFALEAIARWYDGDARTATIAPSRAW